MTAEPMTSGLRHRQADQVRDQIQSVFIELVLSKGFEGFTMQELADSAGVSVRTLYRYFPSREALTDFVREEATRAQEEMQAQRGDRDWTENPEFFAITFEHFEKRRDLIRAGRAMRESHIEPTGARKRTEDLRQWVQANNDIGPESADQMMGLLRLLGSSDSWLRLTDEDVGLNSREAGYAVQWAMEVLINAANDVDGPLRPRGKASDDGDRE